MSTFEWAAVREPVSKQREAAPKQQQLMLTSGLYIPINTYVHTCTHVHTKHFLKLLRVCFISCTCALKTSNAAEGLKFLELCNKF